MKLLGVETVREESRCVCSEDSGAKQSIAKGSSLKEGGVKERSTETGIKESSSESGIKESCSTETGIKESSFSTETGIKENCSSTETGIKESCPYEGVSNNEESSFDTTLTLLIGGKEVCVVKVEGKIVKSSFFIHIVEK